MGWLTFCFDAAIVTTLTLKPLALPTSCRQMSCHWDTPRPCFQRKPCSPHSSWMLRSQAAVTETLRRDWNVTGAVVFQRPGSRTPSSALVDMLMLGMCNETGEVVDSLAPLKVEWSTSVL